MLRTLERRWREAVILGLVLRVVVILTTPVFPGVANTWDSTFYHQVATSLSRGDGYVFDGKPTALFPPGYALALTAPYTLFRPDARSGQGLNLLASLILLLVAASLARHLGGVGAAKCTAAWLALDPTQILMPAFLMSEVLCAALIAGALLAAVAARTQGRWWWMVGLCTAAAGMTRGHAFLLVPAVLVVWWLTRVRTLRETITALTVVAVVCAAGISVWAARNDRVLGSPVLVATNSGMNLLLGNNANARGGRADPPGGLPETGDEVHDERVWREMALTYMREHPGRTLAMIPVKAARLLLPAPATTYREELRVKWGALPAWSVLGLAQLTALLAWAFALPLFWNRRVSRLALGLLGAAIGVWVLGHLPFLGGARYFFPVSFLVVIAASLHLSSAFSTDPRS